MGDSNFHKRAISNMNIHGHKKKLKQITRTIKKELTKPKKEQNLERLKKLNLSRVKRRNKIRELEKLKPQIKRPNKKKRGQKNGKTKRN